MASKYMIYDVISSLKSMVVNYAYSLNEASSPCIYEEYLDQFLTLSKITKELFYYAYNNNWYPLEEAPATKIKKEVTKLQKELKEIKL